MRYTLAVIAVVVMTMCVAMGQGESYSFVYASPAVLTAVYPNQSALLTTVRIANPNAVEAAYRCRFYSTTGDLVSERIGDIPARGTATIDYFPAPDPMLDFRDAVNGSVIVESSLSTIPLALLVSDSGVTRRLLAVVPMSRF